MAVSQRKRSKRANDFAIISSCINRGADRKKTTIAFSKIPAAAAARSSFPDPLPDFPNCRAKRSRPCGDVPAADNQTAWSKHNSYEILTKRFLPREREREKKLVSMSNPRLFIEQRVDVTRNHQGRRRLLHFVLHEIFLNNKEHPSCCKD